MIVETQHLEVRTQGKGTYELTSEIEAIVRKSEVRAGTITIFVQHTSCSLLLMENAAPAARRDLEKFFDQLVPENQSFEHGDEGPDDMPSHIRMALTRTNEVIPIQKGELQLGTWQGVFLFEHRRDPHRRRVVVTVMGNE